MRWPKPGKGPDLGGQSCSLQAQGRENRVSEICRNQLQGILSRAGSAGSTTARDRTPRQHDSRATPLHTVPSGLTEQVGLLLVPEPPVEAVLQPGSDRCGRRIQNPPPLPLLLLCPPAAPDLPCRFQEATAPPSGRSPDARGAPRSSTLQCPRESSKSRCLRESSRLQCPRESSTLQCPREAPPHLRDHHH